MIKINLALKKGPASQSGVRTSGSAASSLLGGLEQLFKKGPSTASVTSSDARQELSREVLTKALLVASVYLGGDFLVSSVKETKLEQVRSESSALQAEVSKLDVEIAKRTQIEQEKKRIEDFEKVLTAKLETIERLMQGRDDASKMLRELSGILPAEVWLNSFDVKEQQVTMRGSALSIEPVTQFLSAVNSSPFYRDGQPRLSEQKNANTGQVIQDFELSAFRRNNP
jgi:Tfp pilus assembly protein PilN